MEPRLAKPGLDDQLIDAAHPHLRSGHELLELATGLTAPVHRLNLAESFAVYTGVADELLPDTSVLVGPRWTPGVVLYTDDEGVHVMDDDYEQSTHPRSQVAVLGQVPKLGEEVLVEAGSSWVRAKVLDVKRGVVRVVSPNGEEWVPPQSLARLGPADEPEPEAASVPDGDDAQAGGGRERKHDFGTRLDRFGWRWGALTLLGFAALAPVFLVWLDTDALAIAASWAALHVILAAYVHALNRPLPRFHGPGFGKPSDPGVVDAAYELDHPPIRSKWELAVFLVGGWMTVVAGATMPGESAWVPAIYVGVLGPGVALLAYFYDRHSAAEARRLLGAKRIRDGVDTGEGCLVGTAQGQAKGPEPLLWREILLYAWSISQQVTKTITDSDGNSRVVNVTETSHYSCGLRRENERQELVLDSLVGAVEVPLRGAIWASERELAFGRGPGVSEVWKPTRDHYGGTPADRNRLSALEQIPAGAQVAVVGELRRDTKGSRMVGGAAGPLVVFSAAEPLKVLGRALLRRRLAIVVMVAAAAVAVALLSL